MVLKVLFHPKQLMLFSGGDDSMVNVWDLVDKSCVATLKGHFSAVTCLALSPDGWHLVSGGRDKVAHVWDLRTNSKVATIPVYEALEGESCVTNLISVWCVVCAQGCRNWSCVAGRHLLLSSDEALSGIMF